MEYFNVKILEKRWGFCGDFFLLEWVGDIDFFMGMCWLGVFNCFFVVFFLLILMFEYLLLLILYFSLFIIGFLLLFVCLLLLCVELVFEFLFGVDKFGDWDGVEKFEKFGDL